MVTLQLFANTSDFETFRAGQNVFELGDEGDQMYVVKNGSVELSIGGAVIETLGPGHIFGEMALIDAQPRSATAKAVVDSEIVPIGIKRFEFLTQQTPGFSLQVMRVLADRLRRTTGAVKVQ